MIDTTINTDDTLYLFSIKYAAFLRNKSIYCLAEVTLTITVAPHKQQNGRWSSRDG